MLHTNIPQGPSHGQIVGYNFPTLRGDKPIEDPEDYLGLRGRILEHVNLGPVTINRKRMTLWYKFEQVAPGQQRATTYATEENSDEPIVYLATQVYLSSGSSFQRDTLLPNWNNSNNWVDCIGGGGGGINGSGSYGGAGGGGGGWARRTNLPLPAGTITYAVAPNTTGAGGSTAFHSGTFGATGGGYGGLHTNAGPGGYPYGAYTNGNYGGSGGQGSWGGPGGVSSGGGGGGAAGPFINGNAGGVGASGWSANGGAGGWGGGGVGTGGESGTPGTIDGTYGGMGGYGDNYKTNFGTGGGGGGGAYNSGSGQGGYYGGGAGGGGSDSYVQYPGNYGSNGLIVIWYEPVATPVISSCAPSSGPTAGGTAVTITGSNFANVTNVTFGGTAATSLVVVSTTTITCTTPAHAAGVVDIIVNVSIGPSGVGTGKYTFVPPVPTVSTCSPPAGTTEGGTPVTITGTNFTGATSVTFGGTAATGVTVVNATTINCTTPAHAPGLVDVTVSVGSQTGTGVGKYTFVTPFIAAVPNFNMASQGF